MSRDGFRLALIGFALVLSLRVALTAQGRQATQTQEPAPGTGAISGVVSDAATKRPLRGVVVSLAGGGRSRQTISDSKGRFVFADLPAGDRYSLQATKAGFIADGLARAGLFGSDTRFPLADGEWIADANLVMRRLAAIGGTVVDERGEPVVNVPVSVLKRVPVAGMLRLAAGPTVRTDDRGMFRVPGLVSGAYFVVLPSVQSVVPPSTSSATTASLSPQALGLGGQRVPSLAGLDIGGGG